MKYVYLKCESNSLAFDQRIIKVSLTRETQDSWYGFPTHNPVCPELRYPKFAWRQVQL